MPEGTRTPSGVKTQNEPETTGKTNLDNNIKTPFSKANGRIRTDNPWFTKPELKTAKDITDKQLTSQEQNDLSTCLDKTLQKHSELQQIIKVWPDLPEHIKQAIKTLIQTHIKEQK